MKSKNVLMKGLPFKELSEWKKIEEDNCYFRHLEHASPNDVTGRVAFIEKTPRIRLNFIKNDWKYGDSEDSVLNRMMWCDKELYESGLYTLDFSSSSFVGRGTLTEKDITYYIWSLGRMELTVKNTLENKNVFSRYNLHNGSGKVNFDDLDAEEKYLLYYIKKEIQRLNLLFRRKINGLEEILEKLEVSFDE